MQLSAIIFDQECIARKYVTEHISFRAAGIIAQEMIEEIITGMLLNAIATIGSTSVTRFIKHKGQVGIVRSPDKFETGAIRAR